MYSMLLLDRFVCGFKIKEVLGYFQSLTRKYVVISNLLLEARQLEQIPTTFWPLKPC